jgi:hypothetical protein
MGGGGAPARARRAPARPRKRSMPKRTDLQSILILGSGPIVIGQAAEFDYSGTQAVSDAICATDRPGGQVRLQRYGDGAPR